MVRKILTLILSVMLVSGCSTSNRQNSKDEAMLEYNPKYLYRQSKLQVKDGIIYTTDMAANNGGIEMTSGNVEITKVSEKINKKNEEYFYVEDFFIRGNRVYYHLNDGSEEHRISIYSCDLDGENHIEITNKGTNYGNFFAYGKYLYYIGFSDGMNLYDEGYEDGGVFRVNLDNLNSEKIIDKKNIQYMTIFNDKLYYECYDSNDNRTIYCAELDGSNQSLYEDEKFPVDGLTFNEEHNKIIMKNHGTGKEVDLDIEQELADGDMLWLLWYDADYVYYGIIKNEVEDGVYCNNAYVYRMAYDKTLVE